MALFHYWNAYKTIKAYFLPSANNNFSQNANLNNEKKNSFFQHKMVHHFEKMFDTTSKCQAYSCHMTQQLYIPRYILKKNKNICTHTQNSYTQMCKAALFLKTKSGNNSNVHQLMNVYKICVYTMNSAIKGNDIEIYVIINRPWKYCAKY